jgi:hypothetical protein
VLGRAKAHMHLRASDARLERSGNGIHDPPHSPATADQQQPDCKATRNGAWVPEADGERDQPRANVHVAVAVIEVERMNAEQDGENAAGEDPANACGQLHADSARRSCSCSAIREREEIRESWTRPPAPIYLPACDPAMRYDVQMPTRVLRVQLQRELDRLTRSAADMKAELVRAFEPERRLRLENGIAQAKQDIARVRLELRTLHKPKTP